MTSTTKKFELSLPALKSSHIGLQLLILAAALLLFAVTIPGSFFCAGTIQSIMFQLPLLGLLALAMGITMLTGGINLSIIAAANACALTMASLIAADLGLPVALLGGAVVAVLIGMLNGFLVAWLNVPAMLATLGTMTLVNGLNILLTDGRVISGFPEAVLMLGNGTIAGIPVSMFIFLACAALLTVLLTKTPLGKGIYLLGSNERATRFSGIDTKRVLLWVYIISGLLCMIAALVMMARFNSAKAGYGESYLLVTILASVLGGIDPNGGFGRMTGLVLALFVLQVVESGLNLMGVSSHLTLALWGIILIAFIAMGRKAKH